MKLYIIILLISLFLSPEKHSLYSSEYNFTLSILYIVLVVYFLLSRQHYTRNWMRIDVLFLLGYTIVHFQIPFFLSFDIEPARAHSILIDRSMINYGTWMSLVAINLWMIGYSLIKIKRKQVEKDSFFKINYFLFDIILLASFVFFIAVVGRAFLIDGIYDGGRSWGGGATYAYLILRTLLYLRIAYFFKDVTQGTSIRQLFFKLLNNKIFCLALLVYFLLFLKAGDRGPVMAILFVVAGLYVVYIRPISFSKLVLFGFIGAFVFTVIAFGRSREVQDGGNILERGYVAYTSTDDDVGFTDELAKSIKMQYYALQIVPDQHPYLNGITFFTQIIGAVPFGSFVLSEVLNIPSVYFASSTFLNITVQGEDYNSGYGTEILADIYINFGIYGVLFIMFLFGWLIAYVTNRANLKDFNYVLVFIVLLSMSLYLNRSMILFPLKDIVYLLFINYLFRRVLV